MAIHQQLRDLGLTPDAPPTLDQGRAHLDAVRCADREADMERLRASEERHRLMFEQSPVATLMFDPESLAIVAANAAAAALYGYSRVEFLALRMTDLKMEQDLPELIRGMKSVAAEPAPARIE